MRALCLEPALLAHKSPLVHARLAPLPPIPLLSRSQLWGDRFCEQHQSCSWWSQQRDQSLLCQQSRAPHLGLYKLNSLHPLQLRIILMVAYFSNLSTLWMNDRVCYMNRPGLDSMILPEHLSPWVISQDGHFLSLAVPGDTCCILTCPGKVLTRTSLLRISLVSLSGGLPSMFISPLNPLILENSPNTFTVCKVFSYGFI